MQKEDISALGGLLAMQGIIADSPLRKKPNKEPSPYEDKNEAKDSGDDGDEYGGKAEKKKKHKKKKKKKDSVATESDIEVVEEKVSKNDKSEEDSIQQIESDDERKEAKRDKKKKKKKKKESSVSSEGEIEDEEKSKKKKKKDKKKKEKKSKKKKKRKHSTSEDSDLEIAKVVKKKHKIDVDFENIPHHLVLHKLNDMIHELEKGVDPEQLVQIKEKEKPGKVKEVEIAYPKIGEAYDPKSINSWSNMRGFQNVAATKSSWLGLTVAPGAQPSVIPEPKISFGRDLEGIPEHAAANDEENGKHENGSNENKDDSDSSSSSSKASTPKESMFKNIFGEEREPSPENQEDDVAHAFKRKEKPEDNQKPKSKSSTLAAALQSRLNQAQISSMQQKDNARQSMERQSLERDRYQPLHSYNKNYDKHNQSFNSYNKHNQSHNNYDKHNQSYKSYDKHNQRHYKKRSRSRSQSHHKDYHPYKKSYNRRQSSSMARDEEARFSVERFGDRDRYDNDDRYNNGNKNKYNSGDRQRFNSGDRHSMEKPGKFNRESSERDRYYDKRSSRYSSERQGYEDERSRQSRPKSKSKSRSASRSSSSSDSSKPRSSKTRNKLTGSVSRKNSSNSSDSDSGSNKSHKRRKITKKRNKLKTIREKKVGKMKNKKGKSKAGVTMNYSEDEKSEEGSNSDEENLHTPALVEENSKLEISDAEEDVMIERIRKQRARLLATLPSADRDLKIQEEINATLSKKNGGGIPISSFEQEIEEKSTEELKEFKTVILSGSVLSDGNFSQVFQVSASVLGQSNSYYQCSFPEVLKKSNSLNSESKKELMSTLQLKSSKFDVSREGLLNVYYKHPKNSSAKTVTEKDLLLGLLIFLQGLGEPVVLFLHYKDSLMPTLLAKINYYNLFDNFRTIVAGCCDLASLARSLRLDTLWDANQNPSLRMIVENVDKGKEVNIDQENASSVLGTTLTQMMEQNKLNIQRVLEMSNKRTLREYTTFKRNAIQAVKAELETEKPEYVELCHSHEAYGTKTRVNLVWTTLEEIKKMLKGGKAGIISFGDKRSNRTGSDEDQVNAKSEPEWEKKTYNCFLAPGNFTIEGSKSLSLDLRVPALQLRLTELRGKSALVEQHPEFTHCQLDTTPSTIQQSATSLFPIITITLRNPSDEDVTLNSKDHSGPIATVKLAVK